MSITAYKVEAVGHDRTGKDFGYVNIMYRYGNKMCIRDSISTGSKEPSGEIACKKQTLPPRGGSTYHVNRVPVHNEPTRSAHSKDFI